MTTTIDGVSAPCAGGVVVHSADAELLELPGGSLMRLLAEGVGTTSTMSVHRSVLRAGVDGANPHHHDLTTELILVVSGSLELLVGECVLLVGAGDLAVIAPGVTHAFGAAADCDADLFDVVTPGTARFDMFRQLSRQADGEQPTRTSHDDPFRYDTYADRRPDWRAALRATARSSS